ncbi:hypothetical protein KA517_00745 [Candidatus Gracilibacteria bacterium]|jgi:hypothetical protein|nr:hypothetical protein [Candidatus Gracilibacteria bacterium]
MLYQDTQGASASYSIHPEHGESSSIVSNVRVGGIMGGWIAFFLVFGGFVYMHISAAADLLNWYHYMIWAIAGMTLVFASAIIGMLVGALLSLAQSRVHQMVHHKEAIAGMLVEIGIRKKIRKLISL